MSVKSFQVLSPIDVDHLLWYERMICHRINKLRYKIEAEEKLV